MGLFSLSNQEDETEKSIIDIKSEINSLQKFVSTHISLIEDILSNSLKLYQVQDTDIKNLRREIINIVKGNVENARFEFGEDFFSGNIEFDSVIKKKCEIFDSRVRAYYKSVLAPLSGQLEFDVAPGLHLSDICEITSDAHAKYLPLLESRTLDFLLFEPADMRTIAVIKLRSSNEDDLTLSQILKSVGIPFLSVDCDDADACSVDILSENVRNIIREAREASECYS
jgi:hypothetical protein